MPCRRCFVACAMGPGARQRKTHDRERLPGPDVHRRASTCGGGRMVVGARVRRSPRVRGAEGQEPRRSIRCAPETHREHSGNRARLACRHGKKGEAPWGTAGEPAPRAHVRTFRCPLSDWIHRKAEIMIFTRRFGALGARPSFPSVTDHGYHGHEIRWQSPIYVVNRRRERTPGGAPDERDYGRDAAAS
jgi:hypothetical protein